MTNALTWDIKPITFPKVNANLLSVISLIVLLTMAFMMVHPAIAAHCGELRSKLALWTIVAASTAYLAKMAGQALHLAMATLNPVKIALAIAAVLALGAAAVYAAGKVVEYAKKLYECEKSHSSASGGCDSGDCDSG